MRTIRRQLVRLALPVLLGASACLPYTVGSTAQTVPAGETTQSMSYYVIPNALQQPGDSVSATLPGMDREWRHGIDARSDVGLRLTSGAGVVLNYKRRFQEQQGSAPALAYIVGTGIVNAGEHAHFEATLLASGDERAQFMPYGGLRAMQVVPISQGAVNDSPTIGVFGGLQIGDNDFTIRPELGVFYDRSALGVRTSNIIFVPAVTLQRREHRDVESRPIRRPDMAAGRSAEGQRSPADLIRCILLACRPH